MDKELIVRQEETLTTLAATIGRMTSLLDRAVT